MSRPRGARRRSTQTLKHLAGVRVASIGGSRKAVLFIAKLNKADLVVLQELLETGQLTPVIDRRYPLSEAATAFHYMGEGHAKGKIAIIVSGANRDTSTTGAP